MLRSYRDCLVSIIVTNHNYEQFIGDAVESALSQTYARCEVIVVDDGSNDRSRTVLRRYGDRIRLLLQDNAGQTSACNAGFAAAKGDIIIFLDADDVLHDGAVAAIVGAASPGMSKVQFPLVVVDEAKNPLGRVPRLRVPLSAEEVECEVRRRGFYPTPPTSGNAYARSFLEQIMPIDPLAFGRVTDGALNTIAPLYGPVIWLGEAFGCYRLHGANMWAEGTLDPRRNLAHIAQGRREVVWLYEHAQRQGVALTCGDPLDHSMDFLEWRLAAHKLEAPDPVARSEHPLRLFRLACGCIHLYETTRIGRLITLAWFLLTALSPRPMAERQLQYRFVRELRPAVLRWLNEVRKLATLKQ